VSEVVTESLVVALTKDWANLAPASLTAAESLAVLPRRTLKFAASWALAVSLTPLAATACGIAMSVAVAKSLLELARTRR
jgi:hypothetical protein